MKFSKYPLLLFLLVSLALGCDRTDMDMETVTVPEVEPTNEYVGDPPPVLLDLIQFLSPCIDEIVFPVELILDDGTTKIVDDWSLLDLSFHVHKILDYTYPIEIIKDGLTIQINSKEELEAESCQGGVPVFVDITFCNCFELEIAYPTDILDQNGTVHSVNGFWDLFDVYDDWKSTQNSNSDFLEFVYPITLIDGMGVNINAENYEDVITIINNECD